MKHYEITGYETYTGQRIFQMPLHTDVQYLPTQTQVGEYGEYAATMSFCIMEDDCSVWILCIDGTWKPFKEA